MGKITEAIEILRLFGLPKAQQNERSAWTLLALLDLKEKAPWSEATKRNIRIHDILLFIEECYKKRYAENTRETIRRQTLHQFEQAGLVIRNLDDPTRPTNSPNTVYAITDEALGTIRKFRTYAWKPALNEFAKEKGRLLEIYEKRKNGYMLSVNLPDGTLIKFSPGKHNRLQGKIIRDFRARFCPTTQVVYVGDTARKMLYLDRKLAEKLKIPITEHNKLPDVILFDQKGSYIFLIEAVTAHGPLTPKRQIELEETLRYCDMKRVYISAFPDFREFKKHIDNIAWDTEVWLESNPDHMIHFNGPKFFSVYN